MGRLLLVAFALVAAACWAGDPGYYLERGKELAVARAAGTAPPPPVAQETRRFGTYAGSGSYYPRTVVRYPVYRGPYWYGPTWPAFYYGYPWPYYGYPAYWYGSYYPYAPIYNPVRVFPTRYGGWGGGVHISIGFGYGCGWW